jgi:iron complex outermembrane recepter protein
VVHGATQSIEVGSADLEQETSHNADLTLSFKDERLDAYVTLFHNQFRDFIFLANSGTTDADGVPILFYSQEDATFNGVEFNIETELAQTRFGRFSATLYGDSVRGELDRSGDVPRMPPWRTGLRFDLDAGALNAYAGILHAADQDHAGEFENETEGYNRVDAGVSYALTAINARDTQLFLRGTNLTNQTIRASTSFLRDFAPEPGRSVEAGVRFSF